MPITLDRVYEQLKINIRYHRYNKLSVEFKSLIFIIEICVRRNSDIHQVFIISLKKSNVMHIQTFFL